MTETLSGRAVDAERFRQALAVHAAGVVVVTAQFEGVPVGLTATSFSSVSLTPPLVSFYVDQSSSTWSWLRQADHFAVNVLASDQAEVAARFARKGSTASPPPPPGLRGIWASRCWTVSRLTWSVPPTPPSTSVITSWSSDSSSRRALSPVAARSCTTRAVLGVSPRTPDFGGNFRLVG